VKVKHGESPVEMPCASFLENSSEASYTHKGPFRFVSNCPLKLIKLGENKFG
jgi:hypothetical protein